MRKRYELRLRPTARAWATSPEATGAMSLRLIDADPIDRFWTRRGAEAALRRLHRPTVFGEFMEPYIEETR